MQVEIQPTTLKVAVHTTPEGFENTALFRHLGLPSTLIRHEKRSLSKALFDLFKPEKFLKKERIPTTISMASR